MAKEDQKINSDDSNQAPAVDNNAQTFSESELFTAPVCQYLSAEQIFAGDEEFYKSLENTLPTEKAEPIGTIEPIEIAKPTQTTKSIDIKPLSVTKTEYNRFSSTQKMLAAAIILIASAMVYTILKSPTPTTSQLPSPPKTSTLQPTATATNEVSQTQIENVPAIDTKQPVSLKIAQTFYLNGEYSNALGVYQKLSWQLSQNPKENLMTDFLQLQMALCLERNSNYSQAQQILRKLFKSDSPAVRVMANYHTCLLEIQKKQYLNARTKAYQAIALIDAIDIDQNWALSLKQNCYFLAAQALTSNVLSLTDTDNDLPQDLWGTINASDEPFVSLDETQIRKFIKAGTLQLSKAILGPDIRQSEISDSDNRYQISSNDAVVEELLVRFAANANKDLYWNLDENEIGIRKRMVSLYMPSATTQQFITVAAGSAGLMAQVDEKGIINVSNPAKYSYASEQISSLSQEAVSLWQNFLLRFPTDQRLANAHFALGLLYQNNSRKTEAVAEYKLLANRFAQSSLATFALLNSSNLKTAMRDYQGARLDLKQLVEQYPDSQITEKAYLYLAQATANTGLGIEAAKLYKKLYNLTFDPELQAKATIGASKCFYKMQDYASAETWLNLYIKNAASDKNKTLYSAYFLLGKTCLALKNTEAACIAFRQAMRTGAEKLTKEEYQETIYALVDGYMQQENFVAALDTLENLYSESLSNQEYVKTLLLKSTIFRAMGLVDKAIAMLSEKAEQMTSPQLKSEILSELSNCCIDKGDLDSAYENLSKSLVLAKDKLLMQEIALKLANVCLKLGQDSQAIFVCSQLLGLEPNEQIKNQALKLMACAYDQRKDYDNAALALLGHWEQ